MWAAKCPNVICSGVGLKPNLSAGIATKAATVAFSRPSSIPRRTSEKGDFACCPTADTDRRTIQPQNKLLIQSLHRFQRKDKLAFGARPQEDPSHGHGHKLYFADKLRSTTALV